MRKRDHRKIVTNTVNKIKRKIDFWKDYKCRKLAGTYFIAKRYKRIYLYHIKKSGGTSLNHSFMSLGGEDGKAVYARIINSYNFRTLSSDKIFVGWNPKLIEKGNYFYAHSHIPAHQLSLPSDTFTITCLRDPVKRVLSQYKMLYYYKINRIDHPGMKVEGMWLGNSFRDFLSMVPKEQMLNQIYMFSKSFSIDEAFERIVNCSHFFFTEHFNRGVEVLSEKLKIKLSPVHSRKTAVDITFDPIDIEVLCSMLAPEYELYNRLNNYQREKARSSETLNK
jgi:hypothetical protein